MNFLIRSILLSGVIHLFFLQILFGFEYAGHRYSKNNFPNFFINANGTPDCEEEFTAIQSALQTWNNINTTYVNFSYGGTTQINTRAYDGTNLIMWVESGWRSIFPGSYAIAVATTWYNTYTGLSYESDILFNGQDFLWSDNGAQNRMDVQNIATHEIGHVVGLADLYGEEDTEKTMYAWSNYGETKKRNLHFDDEDGARYINFDPQTSGTLQESQIWIVSLNGDNINLLNNLLIPPGKSLTLKSDLKINFTGSYKLLVEGGFYSLGTSGQPVTINGQNYSRVGYSNAMVDIKSGGTAIIQYTNFINSPYHVITRYNANTQISHCNFSGFGFDSNSRAITVEQCSTGTADINHCTFTGSGQNGIGIHANRTFGNSNVIIANNSFSSCRYGIRCYLSYAHLTGNTIQNSFYYGIYADNVSNAAKYTGNTVSGNPSSYGVYLTSSSPYLISNEITSNKVFINSGAPNFADPTDPNWRGYNTVANASAALIRVQNYASPYLGYGMASGFNSIYDTDYPHIYATNNSGVYADHNYWGGSPVNAADGTSWVLDRWPLDYNPNLGKAARANPLSVQLHRMKRKMKPNSWPP
jgi:hypothetical protein